MNFDSTPKLGSLLRAAIKTSRMWLMDEPDDRLHLVLDGDCVDEKGAGGAALELLAGIVAARNAGIARAFFGRVLESFRVYVDGPMVRASLDATVEEALRLFALFDAMAYASPEPPVPPGVPLPPGLKPPGPRRP